MKNIIVNVLITVGALCLGAIVILVGGNPYLSVGISVIGLGIL